MNSGSPAFEAFIRRRVVGLYLIEKVRGVSGTPTSRRPVRISTYVVRFNGGGRSTSDDLQENVNRSGRASPRGVVANVFLTQLDTRWRVWDDWIPLDRREGNRRRKNDVGTTITGSHPSRYLLRVTPGLPWAIRDSDELGA